MDISSVLDDVKRRGLVASLRDGEARRAVELGGWSDVRETIVVTAGIREVPVEDALAAFGLASGSVSRNGRGSGRNERRRRALRG